MIKRFGLKNFRIFKDLTYIDLAPITILTGTNNSGKSTVIKALHLLSTNINDNRGYKLDFNLPGEKHNLGDFELAKNHDLKDKGMEFTFVTETTTVKFQFDNFNKIIFRP
jgi:AAA15 family ATPase/GTPase